MNIPQYFQHKTSEFFMQIPTSFWKPISILFFNKTTFGKGGNE